MKVKFYAVLLMLVLLLQTACQSVEPTAPAENNGATESASQSQEPDSGGSNYQPGETIRIGVSAAVTGADKMMGEFVKNAALLAEKKLNEQGGVLGKQVQLVFADEGDNVQSAVTAASKLLNDPTVIGMVGSQISTYSVGSDQVVREAQKPYMAGGSSGAIFELNNTWIHQNRLNDKKAAAITAKAMTEMLGVKKPAILYINDSFGVGMMEKTVAAFKDLGIEIAPENLYATNVDEKQYTSMLSQIMNSDVDGVLACHHLIQASLVMMQAKDIGLEIPCVGTSSYASAVVLNAAGDAANGWYACTDWTEDGQTGVAKEFVDAYHQAYGTESDKASVYTYDNIMLLAEAIKIAGSEDPALVNQALLNDISGLQGVMAKYSSNPERSMADSLLLTINKDSKVTLIERFLY